MKKIGKNLFVLIFNLKIFRAIIQKLRMSLKLSLIGLKNGDVPVLKVSELLYLGILST